VVAAREKLAAAGCSILVVAQGKPDAVTHYVSRRTWQVPIVSDPERTAYTAFGLERTSWLTFLRPRVVWGYLRGMLRGYAPWMPYAGEDVLQLGGDFVLDKLRRVVFAYPSANPADRPRPAAILEALESGRQNGREKAQEAQKGE
jgi:hypothetical protein